MSICKRFFSPWSLCWIILFTDYCNFNTFIYQTCNLICHNKYFAAQHMWERPVTNCLWIRTDRQTTDSYILRLISILVGRKLFMRSNTTNFDKACSGGALIILTTLHVSYALLTIVLKWTPVLTFQLFFKLLEILVSQESSYFSQNRWQSSQLKIIPFGRY